MHDEFIFDLKKKDASFLVSKWVIDRIPYIFNNSVENYLSWKENLSKLIDVDSCSIVFTGSSSIGFSLNPLNNFKKFNKESDIDIAIISDHYFDISWHYLRSIGSKRYDLNPQQQASLQDHVDRLVYWGTIATDKLLPIMPFGKAWVLAFEKMCKEKPINQREIKARIYRDFDSLRAYHRSNLIKIRNNFLK